MDNHEADQINDNHDENKDQQRQRRTDHGTGVIQTVEHNGQHEAGCIVQKGACFPVPAGTALGSSVEQTEENGKTHMAGNRKDGSRKENRGTEAQSIEDIFHACETQGSEDRVYNSVEAEIELRIIPGPDGHEEVLGSLLGDSNHKKGLCRCVDSAVGVKRSDIQKNCADHFQCHGGKAGDNTQKNQMNQKPGGFFFEFVLLVHVEQQKHGRKQCQYEKKY